MAIYSTSVGYNESSNTDYRIDQVGLMLCEAEMNDMKLFEAALHADFCEINAIREGTLLEAEAAANDNANKKGFFAKIKEALIRFWKDKLKPALERAIAQIGAFFGDANSLVKVHDRIEADLKAGKKKNYRSFKGKFKINRFIFNPEHVLNIDIPSFEEMVKNAKETEGATSDYYEIETYMSLFEGMDKKANASNLKDLKDEFKKAYKDTILPKYDYEYLTTENYSAVIRDVKAQITNHKNIINGLKEVQSTAKNIIDSRIHEIDRISKIKYSDRMDKYSDTTITGLNAMCTATQRCLSNVASLSIKTAKEATANAAKILKTVNHYMAGYGDELNEAAISAHAEVWLALNQG